MTDIFRTGTPQTVIVGKGGRTEGGSGDTSLIMKCPKAYQYQMRGVTIPAAAMRPAFGVGLIFAAMRKEWFRQKFAHNQAGWELLVRAAQAEAEQAALPIDPKDEAYALSLFQAYMNHWLKFPRPTPIAVEYKLGPCPLVPGDPEELWRTARLDDLSRYPEAGGALCIGEAKTTSSDISSTVREYELHVQPLLYSAMYAASTLGQARFGPIHGVILDVAQKGYGDRAFKFARIPLEIRPEAIKAFVESARFYVEIAKRITWDSDVMRTYRCTEMHGRSRVDCTYKDLCRFGKSAAGGYSTLDGVPLIRYTLQPGQSKMPWE